MADKKIAITTPFIKLDNFLKFAGVCSTGGEAKIVIKDEQVTVGGETCIMRGKKLYPGDTIEVGGQFFTVEDSPR
ncbi:MAG: RNA-binding S4 domain-containing protein [Oscillospiraceae bacterium]|nr:RNA-binding S4 domain-containing protein [Oscillospiraceae bacterium]